MQMYFWCNPVFVKYTFRRFRQYESVPCKYQQRIFESWDRVSRSFAPWGHFLGTLCSVCAIMSLSSVCVPLPSISPRSWWMLHHLHGPGSWAKRVNKHNKPLLWIYSLGPSLPVRPQPPAQGLTHKHQSVARLKKQKTKHRWKCVNSWFSFFCVSVSIVKTCSSLCGSCEPVVLMEKACGVRHTVTCTKNKHRIHAHAAAVFFSWSLI